MLSTQDIEEYIESTNAGIAIFNEINDALNDALKALNELEFDENGDSLTQQFANVVSDIKQLLEPGGKLSSAMDSVELSLDGAHTALMDCLDDVDE